MRKTMKYRMYPTSHQQHVLDDTLDTCRQVYNQTLAHRKEVWEQRQDTLSLYETNALLTQWKQERPALTSVHSVVSQFHVIPAQAGILTSGFAKVPECTGMTNFSN